MYLRESYSKYVACIEVTSEPFQRVEKMAKLRSVAFFCE
jgi:hypothetical protein